MATRWDVTKAVRASRLPAPSRLIMLVLADVAEVGTAEIPAQFTPSLSVLAEETGLGGGTVKRHLNSLEEAGWVVRLRPDAAAQWRGERTRYRLAIPAGFTPVQVGPQQADRRPTEDPGVGSEEAQGRPTEDPGSAQSEPRVGPETHMGRPTVGHQESDLDLDLSDLDQITSDHSSEKSDEAPIADRPDVEEACRHLADRIAGNGSKRPTVTAKWRASARLMIDKDGRTPEQITKAIDWCQDDPFWQANILSMPKLREKYDQLRLAARRAQTAPGQNRATGANRHVDELTDEERRRRNPFIGAVRGSDYAQPGGTR